MLRQNDFERVVRNGDWHSVVVNAIKLAEESTSAPELRELLSDLRNMLKKYDECRHVVTVSSPFPQGLDAQFVATCVRNCLEDAEAILDISEPGRIYVYMTKRGTSEYANTWVEEQVKRGIGCAKFILAAKF